MASIDEIMILARRAFWPGAALSVLLLSAVSASAASLTVVNPGFEDISGEIVQAPFTFGPLNGWDLYDPDTITAGGAGGTYYIGTLTPTEPDPIGAPGVYSYFPGGGAEGQRVGIAFNFFGSGGGGEYGFVQTLADTVQANTEYTLQVEIGNIASGLGFNLDGFPGYRVDLLAIDTLNGNAVTILEQDINTLGQPANLIPEGEFRTSSLTYITGAAPTEINQNLAIRLVNLNVIDPAFPLADLEVDFDDVRLDAVVVPLPPMLPLIALMVVTLVVPRRTAKIIARR